MSLVFLLNIFRDIIKARRFYLEVNNWNLVTYLANIHENYDVNDLLESMCLFLIANNTFHQLVIIPNSLNFQCSCKFIGRKNCEIPFNCSVWLPLKILVHNFGRQMFNASLKSLIRIFLIDFIPKQSQIVQNSIIK